MSAKSKNETKSEKKKPAAKTSARPTAKTSKPTSPARAKAAPAKTTSYYVTIAEPRLKITTKKPTDKSARSFDTFDAAKRAAIDALVETIEQLEDELTSLKRAGGLNG